MVISHLATSRRHSESWICIFQHVHPVAWQFCLHALIPIRDKLSLRIGHHLSDLGSCDGTRRAVAAFSCARKVSMTHKGRPARSQLRNLGGLCFLGRTSPDLLAFQRIKLATHEHRDQWHRNLWSMECLKHQFRIACWERHRGRCRSDHGLSRYVHEYRGKRYVLGRGKLRGIDSLNI